VSADNSIFFKKDNKPARLMAQMIRYRNRDKGVVIKLGNAMTERHGLYIGKKSHPRSFRRLQ
jgi:hypothetical protein